MATGRLVLRLAHWASAMAIFLRWQLRRRAGGENVFRGKDKISFYSRVNPDELELAGSIVNMVYSMSILLGSCVSMIVVRILTDPVTST